MSNHPALNNDHEDLAHLGLQMGMDGKQIRRLVRSHSRAYRFMCAAPRWCQYCRREWIDHPILTWLVPLTNAVGNAVAWLRSKYMDQETFATFQIRR